MGQIVLEVSINIIFQHDLFSIKCIFKLIQHQHGVNWLTSFGKQRTKYTLLHCWQGQSFSIIVLYNRWSALSFLFVLSFFHKLCNWYGDFIRKTKFHYNIMNTTDANLLSLFIYFLIVGWHTARAWGIISWEAKFKQVKFPMTCYVLSCKRSKISFQIEYRSVTSSNFLFCISAFSWPYFSKTWWKTLTPNLTWIDSWWPEIWPHEYLISPTEISVNWPGSKQLWTRPIYTDFNGANLVFMQLYLEPPWTNPHQIWTVDVFHHAPPIHGIQNAEMQKKVFLWRHHFCTLYQTFPAMTFPNSTIFPLCVYSINNEISKAQRTLSLYRGGDHHKHNLLPLQKATPLELIISATPLELIISILFQFKHNS